MRRLIEIDLIYIVEDRHLGETEIKIEKVKAARDEVFSSKYYASYQNGIQLEFVVKIRDFYKQLPEHQNAELRKIIFNGNEYLIDRISEAKGRYLILDIEQRK